MLLQSTSHMKEAAPGAAASEEVFSKRGGGEEGREIPTASKQSGCATD